MKLGFGSNGEEISFAVNKEDDQCLVYEDMMPPGMLKGGLSASETGEYPLDSQNDPCKFWVCEFETQSNEEEWSTCVQLQKNLFNFPIYLTAGFSTFSACTADCDSCGDYTDERFVKSCGCEKGERKYTQINPDYDSDDPVKSLNPESISVCCDDATQESDGVPVFDETTGSYKLECKPKCLAPECGKWYCKGGGIPGVNEVGCSEWTEGGTAPPEGVDFYADQTACEEQSKCGQWWCNGSGVCQPITQDDPNPSSEENWGGAYFSDPAQCQEWGCGKYYCSLIDPSENPTSGTSCFKVDGVNTAHQEDPSIRNPAYLFESESECEGSCGKYFCPGPGSEFTPTEQKQCSQVLAKTDKSSYGSVFSDIATCGDSGCLYVWSCGASDCAKVLTSEKDPFATYYETEISCCQACNDCRTRECPEGQIYNPSLSGCWPS